MSNVCVIDPITTVGPVCGGHGTCAPLVDVADTHNGTFVCLCDAGWSGASDFQVTSSLTDCHMFIPAITGIWAFYLFCQCIVGLLYVPRVRQLVRKHHAMVDLARSKGRTYGLMQNKPLLALIPYFALGYPMQFIFAVYKLANISHAHLAQDALLTATYIIWRTTFFFAIAMFQSNFLASLLANEKRMQDLIAQNFFVTKLHFAAMFLLSACLIVPPSLGVDPFEPLAGMVCAAVFFLGTSLGMLLISVHAWFVKKHVVEILQRSFNTTHDVRTNRLQERFTRFQAANVRTAMLQFLIYGFFGAFPYMWNKHEWLVPIAWIPVLITVKNALDSLIENNAEQSSSQAATDKKLSQLAGAEDGRVIPSMGE